VAEDAGYLEAAGRYVPNLLNIIQQQAGYKGLTPDDPDVFGGISAPVLVLQGSDSKPVAARREARDRPRPPRTDTPDPRRRAHRPAHVSRGARRGSRRVLLASAAADLTGRYDTPAPVPFACMRDRLGRGTVIGCLPCATSSGCCAWERPCTRREEDGADGGHRNALLPGGVHRLALAGVEGAHRRTGWASARLKSSHRSPASAKTVVLVSGNTTALVSRAWLLASQPLRGAQPPPGPLITCGTSPQHVLQRRPVAGQEEVGEVEVVVPDVQAHCPARARHPCHLCQRCLRVGNEVQREAGDHPVEQPIRVGVGWGGPPEAVLERRPGRPVELITSPALLGETTPRCELPEARASRR
jgi:hypothetical protein